MAQADIVTVRLLCSRARWGVEGEIRRLHKTIADEIVKDGIAVYANEKEDKHGADKGADS